MLKAGMILGDRYEILGKIGTGGMSDVYKAKDHKLNRYVAIKVLKEEFSANENFVYKFKVEAQSAAGLMHPNVVNVYDVGQDYGLYYIVMELVEGITLKNYIEKKARLSVKEAISIAIQVAMGIEAAHNNRIIHRDIKPQNIIISKDGKVKVTDFGIARAATSNTITSNVMGSVHYTSPEQARGGYSDEKSDIYSLGITIFEMLTGRVPFDGETTVAIAIKHIQEPMPSPRDYVDEIPVSVEQIIFKCTQKSPDRRYSSAAELLADLKHSLIAPEEDFVKMIPLGGDAQTKAISESEMAAIKSRTGKLSLSEELLQRAYEDTKKEEPREAVYHGRSRQEYEEEEPEDEEYYGDEEYDEEEDDEGYDDIDPKMSKVINVLTVVAAVIIGCIALFLVFRLTNVFKATPSADTRQEEEADGETITMISVVGLDLDEARTQLNALHLGVETSFDTTSGAKENEVISQSVNEGEQVALNTTIQLVVGSGAKTSEVPSVTGKSEAEARVALENEGFQVTVTTEASESVTKGNVISQNPAGGSNLARGSQVSIVVSSGAGEGAVLVPDLRNLDEMTAKATLTQAGLKFSNVYEEHNDTVPLGLVCNQSFSPGLSVDAGTSIDFTLSLGPEIATYACNYTLNAPADYAGGDVAIVLTGSNGAVLHNATTATFPVPISITAIPGVDSGVLTVTYTANVIGDITAPDGTVIQGNVQQTKTETINLTFTKE